MAGLLGATGETVETIRYDKDADGVVTLTMDDPTQGANTMTASWAASFHAALDRIEAEISADAKSVTGVIVTSGKRTFFAGGDLRLLIQAQPEDAAQISAEVDAIKRQLRRLETLKRPVVAAVNGAALGGGLEIALACHHRILLDAKGTRSACPRSPSACSPARAASPA